MRGSTETSLAGAGNEVCGGGTAHRSSVGVDSTLRGRGARPVGAEGVTPAPPGVLGDGRQPGWWLSMGQEGWASAGRWGQDQQWVGRERRGRRDRQAGQAFQVDQMWGGRGVEAAEQWVWSAGLWKAWQGVDLAWDRVQLRTISAERGLGVAGRWLVSVR